MTGAPIDLTVTVHDIAVGSGAVAVLVWDGMVRPDVLQLGGEPDRIQSISALRAKASVVFRQLPPGHYAIATFQLARETCDSLPMLYDLPIQRIGGIMRVRVTASRRVKLRLQSVTTPPVTRH